MALTPPPPATALFPHGVPDLTGQVAVFVSVDGILHELSRLQIQVDGQLDPENLGLLHKAAGP
jgi:hypothetical protein